MLESGTFPANEVVTHNVSFAEAGNALAEWDRDTNAVTKILVDLDT